METPSSQLNTERKSVYCCYGNKNAYHEWKLAAFDLYANLLLSDFALECKRDYGLNAGGVLKQFLKVFCEEFYCIKIEIFSLHIVLEKIKIWFESLKN